MTFNKDKFWKRTFVKKHFLRLSLLFFLAISFTSSPFVYSATVRNYPNFDDHPSISDDMRKKMQPYLVPLNSHIKPILDSIFSNAEILNNEETLASAGFITLFSHLNSYLIIAKHPKLPGFLFKLFLHNEQRQKMGMAGYEWLLRRCQGAENVRNLIKRKRLKHFSVPDKWLYPLPPELNQENSSTHTPLILVVTDMHIASQKQTKQAWLGASKEVIDELFCILNHGYSSAALVNNIPYTKEGKFACVDTEHPKRKVGLRHVKRYLTNETYLYWNNLISKKR